MVRRGLPTRHPPPVSAPASMPPAAPHGTCLWGTVTVTPGTLCPNARPKTPTFLATLLSVAEQHPARCVLARPEHRGSALSAGDAAESVVFRLALQRDGVDRCRRHSRRCAADGAVCGHLPLAGNRATRGHTAAAAIDRARHHAGIRQAQCDRGAAVLYRRRLRGRGALPWSAARRTAAKVWQPAAGDGSQRRGVWRRPRGHPGLLLSERHGGRLFLLGVRVSAAQSGRPIGHARAVRLDHGAGGQADDPQ
eukprot:ctg_452.g218